MLLFNLFHHRLFTSLATSWGNRFLWDYDPSQDEEIFRAYSAVRDAGVTLFDTADSYGTLDMNGRVSSVIHIYQSFKKV